MRFEKIYIEISNVCNLQCSFCPEVLRPKKIMSPDQFQVVIEKVKSYTSAVTLHVMGEPLAHPQFIEFMQVLIKNSVPLILTSNGTLLKRYHDLLINKIPTNHGIDPFDQGNNHSIIKQINFSIHSFFDNFPQKDITGYLSELVQFSKLFVELNPESFVNFRLWNLQNPDSKIESKNQLVYNLLEKLFVNPELPHKLNVKEQKSYRLDRHIKLHFDTQFEWPSLNSINPPSQGFCYGLKNHIAILTDGSVVPCCLDKEAVINLGSIFENSLDSILNSERAKNIFQGFSRAQAVEELCQKCQFKQRFHKQSV